MIGNSHTWVARWCCAIAALLSSVPAAAQDQVADAAQIRADGGSLPVVAYAPPSDGKEMFFAQGIQGEVRVRVIIGIDGALREASIVGSSRSPELDAFALGLVRLMTFRPAKDKTGQPVAVVAQFPVELWKDSATNGTLAAKSCGDFVIDSDWFRQAFPEKNPDQLRVWLLMTGIFFAQRYVREGKADVGPDFQAVYHACRAKPKRNLVETYKKMWS